jgi:hypothetical protein
MTSSTNTRRKRARLLLKVVKLLDFKYELRHLWKKYYIYDGSPMNNVTLKIGTKNNRSLDRLLVRKKPPRAMLTIGDPPTVA